MALQDLPKAPARSQIEATYAHPTDVGETNKVVAAAAAQGAEVLRLTLLVLRAGAHSNSGDSSGGTK